LFHAHCHTLFHAHSLSSPIPFSLSNRQSWRRAEIYAHTRHVYRRNRNMHTQEISAHTRDICTDKRCSRMHTRTILPYAHTRKVFCVSLDLEVVAEGRDVHLAGGCICRHLYMPFVCYLRSCVLPPLLCISTNSLLSTTTLNQHQPANINHHQSATVKQQQPATVESEALFSGSCAAPALLHHGSHVQASWVPEVRLVHGRVRYHRNSYHCNRYHCNRHHCNRHHCNKTGRRPREASLQQTAA